jgi:hypothetical protein
MEPTLEEIFIEKVRHASTPSTPSELPAVAPAGVLVDA